jgi:hypothetical protein
MQLVFRAVLTKEENFCIFYGKGIQYKKKAMKGRVGISLKPQRAGYR